jgi:Leucine-rich repeat (LRR) protein
LNNNQITGIIPHWLGDSLSRLQALGLSDNLLIGSIPGSLATGLAANLKTLSLDGNMLTGDIATLQRLRYLEFLYLNDNDFEGRLDHGLLADMPYLMEVDLSNNRISKGVPDYLFQMNSLKVLDVSHNFLTGGLPFDVGSGRRGTSPLEFVSLRNNSLAESIPASLMTHLGALTHFDLSFNLFTGDCPQAIGDMTGLSYLFLGDNNLVVTDGTIPGHLQSLTNLRELSLGNLDLQGPIPTWLEGFENLRLLDLSQNQLTGSLDLDFTQLSQLLVLLLHDNRLTGNLPPSLASLQDLTVLSLHHNEFLDESNTAGMVCDGSAGLELMTVDCGAVNCPCCGDCCDSDTCYEGVVWETLEYGDGQWEENFERSDYSFNPRITLAGPIFEAGCGKNCV